MKTYKGIEAFTVIYYSTYCIILQDKMISLKSKITKKVLSYFMLHPEAELYINEMSSKFEVDSGNLTRKLKEIENEGIFISRQRGLQRFYKLNHNYPLLEHYKKIILSTIGIEYLLKEILSNIHGIGSAFIYGSYAKDSMNAGSDIDIFIVGDHDTIHLQKELSKIQKNTDREINLFSITKDEFEKRKNDDTFVKTVMKGKKIGLV